MGFPLIGIGASAGGLEAARDFVEALPADPGMAFVLVMHLAPDKESRLSEILQNVSKMPVHAVSEAVEVERDHVYVIRPGDALTLADGRLVPVPADPLSEDEPRQAVIDRFFRSLAQQWRERAVGIVLFSRMMTEPPGRDRIVPTPDGEAGRRKIDYPTEHVDMLVEQLSSTSILVRSDYTVVDVAKEASSMLRYPKGSAPHAVLDIVPTDLRPPLRSALFQFFKKGKKTNKSVRCSTNGNDSLIHLVVQPVGFDDELAQVLIEETPEADTSMRKADDSTEDSAVVDHLQEEIRDTRERLQTTIEQYESSTEELRASNEELLSMNEELQSTTEELETGREELQSMNEELSTVNDELERKIVEVQRANSDLENFISAADIGTIFLDEDFRVRRFTPRVTEIFNLISSDAGRSITDITHGLKYEGLAGEVRDVYRNHSVVEREVGTVEGEWYIMRMRPYRSVEEEVSGVVISFFNITDRKEVERHLRKRTEELEGANEKIRDDMRERERLQQEVLSASEEERWRLGESLHNDLGQQLTGIQMLAQTLAQKLRRKDSKLAGAAEELADHIRTADKQTDALIAGIIPVAMDDQGLAVALETMARNLEDMYAIDCCVRVDRSVPVPDNTDATRLYRIAQEASHNAIKHGSADELVVALSLTDGRLVLAVEDNGNGFSRAVEEAADEGMGIRLMRYRCDLIGGEFSIESGPKGGARIACSVPVDDATEESA